MGLVIVVGVFLLMSMLSLRVIPTPAEAAIAAQWTPSTPLNAPRSEAVVVQDDAGLVYVVGGMNTTGHNTVNNAASYDTGTGQWIDLAAMPQSTRGAAGAYFDGKIYVFGGYDSSVGWLNDTQIYDTASNSWSTGTDLPQRLWQAKAGVGDNGLIYVFGGKTPAYTYSNSVYIYNPATDGWSNGVNMPVGSSGGAVVSHGYAMYYIGGTNGSGGSGATNAVYVYYTWNSWDTLAPLPLATEGLAAVMGADGLVYAFGGAGTEGETGQGYNATYYFDTWNEVWHDGPDMINSPRYLAGAATTDGRILAIGGANVTGVLTGVSSMRVMSVLSSIAPSPVQTGRSVLVTVSVDFANAVPRSYSGNAVLVSGSGTSFSQVLFNGAFEMTFAFQMVIPVNISAGAYTVNLNNINIQYVNGGTTLPQQKLSLGVVVGETLDEQIQSLLDEIAALQAVLATENGNVSAVSTQLAALNTYVTDLQSQLTALKDQQDKLQTKANTASTYGMINIVLVIVILALLALMFMMSRKPKT
jgi:N-acetylneuraminic acid mutarotase